MAPEEGAEPQASPKRKRRGTPCGLTLMAAGPLERRYKRTGMVLNRDRWETAIRGYPIGSDARNLCPVISGATPMICLRLSPQIWRAQDRQLPPVPPLLSTIAAGAGMVEGQPSRKMDHRCESIRHNRFRKLVGRRTPELAYPLMDAQADITLSLNFPISGKRLSPCRSRMMSSANC